MQNRLLWILSCFLCTSISAVANPRWIVTQSTTPVYHTTESAAVAAMLAACESVRATAYNGTGTLTAAWVFAPDGITAGMMYGTLAGYTNVPFSSITWADGQGAGFYCYGVESGQSFGGQTPSGGFSYANSCVAGAATPMSMLTTIASFDAFDRSVAADVMPNPQCVDSCVVQRPTGGQSASSCVGYINPQQARVVGSSLWVSCTGDGVAGTGQTCNYVEADVQGVTEGPVQPSTWVLDNGTPTGGTGTAEKSGQCGSAGFPACKIDEGGTATTTASMNAGDAIEQSNLSKDAATGLQASAGGNTSVLGSALGQLFVPNFPTSSCRYAVAVDQKISSTSQIEFALDYCAQQPYIQSILALFFGGILLLGLQELFFSTRQAVT